jgi:hypothetical protein
MFHLAALASLLGSGYQSADRLRARCTVAELAQRAGLTGSAVLT